MKHYYLFLLFIIISGCIEEKVVEICDNEEEVALNRNNFQFKFQDECCRIISKKITDIYNDEIYYDYYRYTYNKLGQLTFINGVLGSDYNTFYNDTLNYDNEGFHVGTLRTDFENVYSYNQENQLSNTYTKIRSNCEGCHYHPNRYEIEYNFDLIIAKGYFGNDLILKVEFYLNDVGNIVKKKIYRAVWENGLPTGEYYLESNTRYTYDRKKKPIQRLFDLDKLSAQSLSRNNITEEFYQQFNKDGTEEEYYSKTFYAYEYNDYGYPTQIIKWGTRFNTPWGDINSTELPIYYEYECNFK